MGLGCFLSANLGLPNCRTSLRNERHRARGRVGGASPGLQLTYEQDVQAHLCALEGGVLPREGVDQPSHPLLCSHVPPSQRRASPGSQLMGGRKRYGGRGNIQAVSLLGLALAYSVSGPWCLVVSEGLRLGDPVPMEAAPLGAMPQRSLSLLGHGICLGGWGPHRGHDGRPGPGRRPAAPTEDGVAEG